MGMLNLLYFTGMLSLSLGIMNLIPFPHWTADNC